MMDERSEAVGYAVHYEREAAWKREDELRERYEAALCWLMEEIVLANWTESDAVIRETLEDMGAPSAVIAALERLS